MARAWAGSLARAVSAARSFLRECPRGMLASTLANTLVALLDARFSFILFFSESAGIGSEAGKRSAIKGDPFSLRDAGGRKFDRTLKSRRR
jgi:hypothetical protein